jgi:predicted SAM-dependent methyltransferase
MNEKIKINLGCGSNPLEDYINVDMDTLDDLRERYPHKEFSDDIIIEQWDIFNLPLEDDSVDVVKSDCLFEHLSFKDEKRAFMEVKRVLKPGGTFDLAVPDMEHVIKAWLEAEDDWKDWFRDDDEAISQKHWFGTYEYSFNNRWGYLTASLFGSQNGEGQYHKNGYTMAKLKNIFKVLDFEIEYMETFPWTNDGGVAQIIRCFSKKK